MKHFKYLLLILLWVTSFGLKAETPEIRVAVTGPGQVTVLDAIMGDHPAFGEAAMEVLLEKIQVKGLADEFAMLFWKRKLGKADNTARLAQARMPESPIVDSVSWSQIHFLDGIFDLLDRDYTGSIEHFRQSEALGLETGGYKVIATYLNKYGDQSPLFPKFNGGFFHFASDSLGWNHNKPDSLGFLNCADKVMDLIILSEGQPVYHELLGDLFSQSPDRFTANWFGSLPYYRAGFFEGMDKDVFRRKALFALEAPRSTEMRFDQYRIVQMGKHIGNDLDSMAIFRASYLAAEKAAMAKGGLPHESIKDEYGEDTGNFVWLAENDRGRIARVLRKAEAEDALRSGRDRKFAGEVDLKTVKADATFNVYAIVVILVVIAAAIFLGVQIKRNSPES